MPPRAVLIKYASGFISASSRRPIRPRVLSVSGQWIETKSLVLSSSSKSNQPHAELCGYRRIEKRIERNGGFMPQPASSSSSLRAMPPRPITPSVRSRSSRPM